MMKDSRWHARVEFLETELMNAVTKADYLEAELADYKEQVKVLEALLAKKGTVK